MSDVCPNVATKFTLQPVTNEQFFYCSTNTEFCACLHVRAQGFWGVHVFNPLATTNYCTSSVSCFRSHDKPMEITFKD